MNVMFDCALCSMNGVLNLFKKGLIEEKYHENIFKELLKYYSNVDFSLPSTAVNRGVKNIICDITGVDDIFKPLKVEVNKKALIYKEKYEPIVQTSSNPIDKSMRSAIDGNIIDFGPTHNFNIEEKLKELLNAEFPIDHSEKLFNQIKSAKSILYITDNTGEIIFDELFLRTINHANVTVAVRHKPILNDATKEDAIFAGIKDRKSTRLNSSHQIISYAVFCLK